MQKSPVDWNAIVDSGLEIGLNAAELALGADGAPILAIVMVIKIEIAILGMVSDQIKWAKRETARGAAADFIGVAAKIAKHQASGFVADCELAVGAKQPRVAELATAKVLREAPQVAKALQVLSSHIARHSKDSIGGYPDMVSALGRDAMRFFNNPAPPEDPLNVAEQLQVVFAGRQFARASCPGRLQGVTTHPVCEGRSPGAGRVGNGLRSLPRACAMDLDEALVLRRRGSIGPVMI